MLFQRRVPKKVRVLKRTPKKSKLFCSATLSTKENLANSRNRQSPFALANSTIPPTPVTLVTSVTSGKITNFVEKNTIENVYFFFTHERCRRRLPLIKMINGGEEVFVLLFSALEYEYLFWKFRLTRLRLFKDSIGLLAHDKKKGTRQKEGHTTMFLTDLFRVWLRFKVWEYKKWGKNVQNWRNWCPNFGSERVRWR